MSLATERCFAQVRQGLSDSAGPDPPAIAENSAFVPIFRSKRLAGV